MSTSPAESGSSRARGLDPLDAFRLDDRLIVVTGASEGIGCAFAEDFARAGATVVLASRRRDKLERVRDRIRSAGGRAESVITDVTRLSEIQRLTQIVRELASGTNFRIGLVNNAGVAFTKLALEVSESEWDALFDVHVKGTFFCSQQIGSLMLERRYGKILNLSSTWAVATEPGKSAYCAAKAAISQMTAALATEWASSGVRVNALAPTTTMTDVTNRRMSANPERAQGLLSRIKLGRFAAPEDLVGSAIFLISSASDFMTGQTVFVDGGFTI
jgi:NAD(P)-dependent dehydrogenase (short-subunit alcohol dehydrogenase family)